MPALRIRGAPKRFKGSPHDVSKFLAHLDKLFAQNNVTISPDKVKCMAKYCSSKVVNILEGMPNYTKANWSLLQCHCPHDLKKLTDQWRKRNIKSMIQWCQYLQEFTTVSGWRIHQTLMEEAEADHYLWQGDQHPLTI
ncbi:hypothetical protein C8J57DRAFT_1531761 [Mycena rebaudengoi]|nr:hypothetical protein C8J57DRAFT_1531761 [Mycena rebaudengoi]